MTHLALHVQLYALPIVEGEAVITLIPNLGTADSGIAHLNSFSLLRTSQPRNKAILSLLLRASKAQSKAALSIVAKGKDFPFTGHHIASVSAGGYQNGTVQ